jgi:hypothetical protein
MFSFGSSNSSLIPQFLWHFFRYGRCPEHFLISTHDFVDKLFHLKTQNYDEYIGTLAQRREEAEKLIKTASAASSV